MFETTYNQATPRSVILQRYLALTSKAHTLELQKATPPSPPTDPPMSSTAKPPHSPTMSASTTSSANTSPTLEGRTFSTISLPACASTARRSSTKSPAIEPIPEDDVPDLALQIPQISTTEDQLYHVNSEIKSTLTDLLNCEAVRHDLKTRMWIQSRLMDAELELKRQRRRRSTSNPTPTITLTPSPDEETCSRPPSM